MIVRSKPKKKEKIVSYDVEITPQNNAHGIKSQKWDMRKEDDDRKKFDDYFESEVVKEQNRRRYR